MKTNETKMKKMMVKGVCSVALAGTVFGTVAPMVENNVAMAWEVGMAYPEGTSLWNPQIEGDYIHNVSENGRTFSGNFWLANAKVKVKYDKEVQKGDYTDYEEHVLGNTQTDGNGYFTVTSPEDIPAGEIVWVEVYSPEGTINHGKSGGCHLQKGLILEDNGGEVTPEPEKPTEPDNGGDVTPEPEKPTEPDNGGDVTPEPEKPVTPDNGGDVTPEPEKPVTPDNGGDVTPEPEKPSEKPVTPEKPATPAEKPAEKPAKKPTANNESATNQQPTYNTGDTLAKTATTNNSVILAAIGGIASLVMGLETLISRKK